MVAETAETGPDSPAKGTVLAVVPVREGELPAGTWEVVAESDGAAVLVGEGAAVAAGRLADAAPVAVWETPGFQPGRWARGLAAACGHVDLLLLPASPDGRDLAPRLAARLRRPLLAGAVEVGSQFAVLPRDADRRTVRVGITGPAVITVRPGTGGRPRRVSRPPVSVGPAFQEPLDGEDPAGVHDAETVSVVRPTAASLDLSEARRVVAGGAGLLGGPADADSHSLFSLLARAAEALDASLGATGVVTDAKILPAERQIGISGARVNPDLYIALGISGAAQHLSATGDPAHTVAVNLDPSCSMMAVADLALVTDARELLVALARKLGVAPEAAPE